MRDLVLLGGGHAHVLCIRKFAMRPVAGVRVTLISSDVLTPYSGMLPGYIAGHYTSDEIHIDLTRLCEWAGVRFIEATATAIDPDDRVVVVPDRPAIGYDCLSIDTGSTPDLSVPGAAEYAYPVKPIHRFQQHWNMALRQFKATDAPGDLAVVGSGVGGFELLLAIDHALQSTGLTARLHWVIRGSIPLSGQPERAQRLALETCQARKIQCHTNFDVAKVTSDALISAGGGSIATGAVFWVTAAASPAWPRQSGLRTDQRGFIAVNEYLQSLSHQNVFAAGDVATQIDTPAPKAGVYAVRQASVLYQNLLRHLCDLPLKRYKPQRHILALMALGEKRAIASRNGLVFSGGWVWRWKDYIDRSFMRQFEQLKARSMARASINQMPAVLRQEALAGGDELIRCSGLCC